MSWDFIRIKERTARRAYRCYECNAEIKPGTRYVDTCGKVEGEFMAYALCVRCNAAAQAWCEQFDAGEGWPMGELFQSIRDEGVEDVDAWIVQVEAKRQARVQRLKDQRARVEALGESVICPRCGATLQTYAEACTAALDERCPGFEAIERAKAGAPAEAAP